MAEHDTSTTLDQLSPARRGARSRARGRQPVGAALSTQLLGLQASAGNRAVTGLLASYGGATARVQRLMTGGEASVAVDIGTLTYEQLHHYQSLYNQRQIEPGAHEGVFDDAGEDIRLISERLALLEPAAAEVRCGEGETKLASAIQKIDFGGVTSCMTITCVLADARKIVSHEAVARRSNAITAIPALIATAHIASPITAIHAVGVGGSWTYRLEVMTPLNSGDRITNAHEADFTAFLKTGLGVAGTACDFTDHIGGSVRITAAGGRRAAQIDEALGEYLDEHNPGFTPNHVARSAVIGHLEGALGVDTATATEELENFFKNANNYAPYINMAA